MRSAGEVRFAAVSSRRQMGIAGLVAVLVLWSLYVTVVYFSYDSRLAESDAKIAEVRAAYQRIVAERDIAMQQSSEAYRSLLASVSNGSSGGSTVGVASEYELIALRTRTSLLGQQVADLQTQLAGVSDERARLAASDDALAKERDSLTQQLAALQQERSNLADNVTDLKGQLEGDRARYADLGRARDDLADKLKTAETDNSGLHDKNDDNAARIASLESNLSELQDQRDKMAAERGTLDQKVGDLQHHLASLQADQQALVKRLSERAASNSNQAERTIAMTGLNVDKLLAEVMRDDDSGGPSGSGKNAKTAKAAKTATGKGGPFVALKTGHQSDDQNSLHSVEIDRLVSALDSQEDRRAGLRKILERLPLASPIEHYRIMSPFGPRIDPFNGRYAMHEGVDLASTPGAPVLATAPGIVTFAGWDGSYGKMVEIDHGMGIHTRYAHLRTIVTEVGRRVSAGTQIGVLGSTGRSTGPHVHYEIRVDDHPHNPVKFIQAGEYVFSKN